MLNRPLLVLLLIPLGAVLMAGCAKQDETSASPSSATSAPAQAGASAPTYAVRQDRPRTPPPVGGK